ncbi:MAG: DegV family protein [Clostridia bacterium]|nr:DegV family protein [Clostridia bacterium]
MNNYVIFTDSSCDLSGETLNKWGVYSLSLTFRFNDSEKEYKNDEMEINDFYSKMKAGSVAKTSAVNSESFLESFEHLVKEGKDILYLGFSSGLSTTFNSARLAKEELSQKYPERKIYTVDTLCASAGLALLLRLVLDAKENGATIDEARDLAEQKKQSICHWFTVDDLVYLKRGGRVSPTVALVGNMLGIKPILHVDREGHLVSVSKIRGRRAAIETLAAKYGELALTHGTRTYISHASCENDAILLSKILKEKYGAETEIITNVGTVIGAHAGPGTLALFFEGKER